MTNSELREIGVNSKLHRNAILEAVQLLPELEIEPCVPVSLLDCVDLCFTIRLHHIVFLAIKNEFNCRI